MRTARVLGWGALLFLASFTLYLMTLSRHYSADSMLFARAIESGSWRDLVNLLHLPAPPTARPPWLRLQSWSCYLPTPSA